MLDNSFGVACPTACDTVAWGAVQTLDIKCLPDPTQAAINFLTLGIPGVTVPPADWTLDADWAAVIDNADITGTLFKRFPCTGEVAESEPVTFVAPGLQQGILKRNFTATFTLTYLPDDVYEFFRTTFQCGNVKPIFYYEDVSKLMYGSSTTGIVAESIDVQFPKGSAEDSFNQVILTIGWESKVDPERITSPLQ